jgi:YHS domain-containing protein
MADYKEPKNFKKTTTKVQLALNGIDPVTYFGKGQPEPGQLEYTAIWNGLTYCFRDQRNLDLFNKRPLEYLPQFAGNCAFACAFGGTADGSPKAWKISDGKLYFFANPIVRTIWSFFPILIPRSQKSYAAKTGMR